MKKNFRQWMLTGLAVGMMFLSGCSENGTAPKVLRMATNARFAPYESFQNGHIVGIDVDIVREVAKKYGCEVEIVDMPFEEVSPSVQSGKCHVAASAITITPERAKEIDFTIPYITTAQVIVVPVDSPIRSAEDLKDPKVRIGVLDGYTSDLYVTEHFHTPVRYTNTGTALVALLSGSLDAAVCDAEPARLRVAQRPDELKILPEPLTKEEYAFGFAKGNQQLLLDFNRELAEMRESGRLQEILNRHRPPEQR